MNQELNNQRISKQNYKSVPIIWCHLLVFNRNKIRFGLAKYPKYFDWKTQKPALKLHLSSSKMLQTILFAADMARTQKPQGDKSRFLPCSMCWTHTHTHRFHSSVWCLSISSSIINSSVGMRGPASAARCVRPSWHVHQYMSTRCVCLREALKKVHLHKMCVFTSLT